MAKKQVENKQKPEKKLTSIKSLMVGYTTIFLVSLFIILCGAAALAFIAIANPDKESYTLEIEILLGAFVLVTILLVITVIRVYRLCYKHLYETSKDLVQNIAQNKRSFKKFPKKKIQEFEVLNKEIEKAEEHLQRSIVYSSETDYSSLNLEYNEELGTVKFDSFEANIPEIIMLSQAYRNAFVYVTYGEKFSDLIGQTSEELVKHIRSYFNYENILIAEDKEESGYIVYIPQIDSFNRLKEEVELLIKNVSMVKNTPNGKALVSARVSVVIYPFSDVPDILTDLHYANRQGLNVNFYFPERTNVIERDKVMHGAYSLNRSNQLLARLSTLRIADISNKDLKEVVRKQLSTFGSFINADYSGVIMRDDRVNRYSNFICISNRKEPFQVEGELIEQELIDAIEEVMDEDGSYYFSLRSHLSPALGKYLDKYGVTSGYIYVTSDNKGALGIIYYLNYQKEMALDSYLRETALSVSLQISTSIRENNQELRLKSSEERSDMLMKISDYMLYAIDKSTHEIVYTSETFADQFGDVMKQTCYKAIYGLEKPCPDCPLVSQAKMLRVNRSINYETSPAMSSDSDDIGRLLVKRVSEDAYNTNRFDVDFLINSYAALVEDLENSYMIQGRGYVLLLSLENHVDLLSRYGSDGYLKYVRAFVNSLNDTFDKEYRCYVFDNSKIAMIIPETGRTEIVDLCEKIYEVSKSQFIEFADLDFIPLEINYISLKYPQEYATHTDLLRQVEQATVLYSHKEHVDEIYFHGSDYFRCASRTQFINEVIDKSFKDKTFKVNLQPMVSSSNKHISGAEILIRLSDDYRGQALSPYEVIKVAGEQKKIGLISNALLEYIGDLYEQQGNSLFKSHQFSRLSFNTDFSYFSEETFMRDINDMLERYEFPRDFLSFEINENELFAHFRDFEIICNRLRQIGVHIAVDQYTGKYVSLDKIRNIGIPEVKIPRNMVKDIDVNRVSLNALQDLIKTADNYGLKVSVVGVENKDQYMLIRDMSKDALMQGYYFYEPLEVNKLIEAIKIGEKQ